MLSEDQLKWDITCSGKEILIKDTETTIKELYGGFGQGQKILTIPQIAMLHVDNPNDKNEVREKVKRINELISNNLILDSGDEYFEFGIDIIDLKADINYKEHKACIKNLIANKIYTQNSVNRANNLYILSEQGYSLLINLMTDTKSKIIYKNVIRDYFRMRELVLSSEDTEQYLLRTLGKKERKKTTDTIKFFIEKGDLKHNPNNIMENAYALETNFIYKILFGMKAKDIESFLGLHLKKNDTVRNYLCIDDIDVIREAEGRVHYMMQDGKSYQEIQSRLKELYKPRKPKLAGKDINIIRKLLADS